MNRSTFEHEVQVSAGQYFQWHDLFVVVDDGAIPVVDYDPIESALKKQAEQFTTGVGCLVILPPGAKPPPNDVQARVRKLLANLESSLTSLGYLIEGSGFKAVAARAALVGMKIFSSRPYPIFVETSMPAVVRKMLLHLKKGSTVTADPTLVINAINDARHKWTLAPSGSTSSLRRDSKPTIP